jgi:hypothetical protein
VLATSAGRPVGRPLVRTSNARQFPGRCVYLGSLLDRQLDEFVKLSSESASSIVRRAVERELASRAAAGSTAASR